MANTVVKMPQLGESVAEGTIGRWLKQPGERVERDEPLVEIQTDKVNAEVASPVAGIPQQNLLPQGTTAGGGAGMGVIRGEGPPPPSPWGGGGGGGGAPPPFFYDSLPGGGGPGVRVRRLPRLRMPPPQVAVSSVTVTKRRRHPSRTAPRRSASTRRSCYGWPRSTTSTCRASRVAAPTAA